MGRVCGKHEQFIPDGEECGYCAPLPRAAPVSSRTNVAKNNLLQKLREAGGRHRKRAPGDFYGGYDILDVGGGPLDHADIDNYETPAVKQANGLTLPAMPLCVDPSLRADLSAAWDAAQARETSRGEVNAQLDEAMRVVRALTEQIVDLQKQVARK